MKEHKNNLRKFRNSRQCQECGSKNHLTLHHIIPKSLDGKNVKSNIVVLCRKCHTKEHTMNHKKKWTNHDIELIILLRKQGYKYEDISCMLGRSIYACTTMVHNIKMGVDNLSMEIYNEKTT